MFVKEVPFPPNHLIPRAQSMNTNFHMVSRKLMRETTICTYDTNLNIIIIIKTRTKEKGRAIQYLIQRYLSTLHCACFGIVFVI